MTSDQAQSPRLGQRVAPESTYVRMFSGDEIPEAAWPGQIIYRNEEQTLQIYNGEAWENVTGGALGQLTFVGSTVPVSQNIGDVWFNTADNNRMHVAKSVGADQIATGEWEVISGGVPPITATTHIYRQDSPPTAATSSPVPKENDFWYETPINKQYYYMATAPGNHWVAVRDTGIDLAINTSITEYSVNASESVAPTTGWSTATPTRAPGTFIWVRTTTTRNDGTVSTSSPALMTGNTGVQGSQGIPGPTGPNGQQLYTWVKYADTPTTGMSDSPAGKGYLGLSYNQPSPTESSVYSDYQWSLTAGSQGVQGPPGPNGQPTYTWIKYGTSSTGAGINDSSVGMTHIGIAYNQITPTESTNPLLYEWSLIQGPQGVQGPAGSQGIQGPAGPNGQSLYTWIKYADTPTTGMNDLPAGKAYMGIAYNKTSGTESSTYTDYEWSLVQGPQGNTGIQGPAGPNGQPTYTWIKYADTVLGAGMNDLPAGKTYMGIAYNKTTATESSTPGDYEWSLIQGPQGVPGAPAATVTLISTTQALVSPAGGGATTPATATVTGSAVNTTLTVWEYSVNSAAFSASVPAGVSRTGNVVTITGSSMTASTIAVRMADAAGVADTLTVAKVLNGATGGTGGTGPAGADAYTVILTNEAHAFPGTTTTAVAGSTVSTVIAYKAAVLMPATIGTITGQATGLTTAITNNGTTTATVTITVTTALVTNGELTIPVTVDGVAFTKKLAWTVSYTGAQGSTGVSITAVTPYFGVVTKGAAAPALPAVATPLAPWVATEPAYTTNTELYRTDKVTYSNATFTYTTVTKSSAYTAAVQAGDLAATKTGASLCNNPSRTGNLTGWANPTGTGAAQVVETVDFNGTSIKAVKCTGTGDNSYFTDTFDVEVNQAYEVRLWVKDPTDAPTANQFYVGLNGYDAVGATAFWEPVLRTTGAISTASSNFYFGYTPNTQPTWTEWVYYILPIGTNGLEGIGLGNGAGSGTPQNARFMPNIVRARVRFLSWSNAGVSRDLWVANITVTPVSMEVLRASKARSDAAQTTANSKTKTYYLPGFTGGPDMTWVDPDPGQVPPNVRPNLWVPIVGQTVGDTWFQTDDRNHPWYYNGTTWLDAQDPNVNMITTIDAEVAANQGGILDLNTQVEANAAAAGTAQSTADTADGRVSMSDYPPTKEDVAGRNQGSIWLVRTRPRANLCPNPSFETNGSFWSGAGGTAVRTLATVGTGPALDGNYFVRYTNSAVVTTHYYSSYAAASSVRYPCAEGQTYTASAYLRHFSGLNTGVYVRIYWYDVGGVNFTSTLGTAVDLPIPAVTVPPTLPSWERLYVTGTAPAGAVTFFVRVLAQAANINDVWDLDGLLIEQDEDLGRYFDGDSFDGSWEDPVLPSNSPSTLEGNKILQVWELLEEDWNRKYFTEDAISGLDAIKLTGTLDGAIIGDNTIAPDKMIATQVLASEALQPGDLVHVWNSTGNFRVRRADSTLGYEAHGFVLDAATLGSFVPVFHQGYNPFMLNLVPGAQFLAAAGKVTAQPPWQVGQVAQRVGFAPTTSVLNFSPMQPIRII